MVTKQQTRLEPGVYRLTEDMPALRNDKRRTRDWRYRPMSAGTLFLYSEFPHQPNDDGRVFIEQRLWPLGTYEHLGVSPGESYETRQLEELLQRQDETPSQWIRREHNASANTALGALDKLVELGLVSMADVQKAVRDWLDE